jgi:hypothetical protein
MPIRKYIAGAAFDPKTIEAMVTAFERLKAILNLNCPDDPLIEGVAKKIISLASRGITDPKEIERIVMADTE